MFSMTPSLSWEGVQQFPLASSSKPGVTLSYGQVAGLTHKLDSQLMAFEAEKSLHEKAQESNVRLRQDINLTIARLTNLHLRREGIPVEEALFKPDEAQSLRQLVHEMHGEDEKRVIIVRRTRKLGLRAEYLIARHFETVYNCRVLKVRLVFSRCRGIFDNQHGIVKPANMGFVVLDSERAVSRALAEVVDGVTSENVFDFRHWKTESILLSPFSKHDDFMSGYGSPQGDPYFERFFTSEGPEGKVARPPTLSAQTTNSAWGEQTFHSGQGSQFTGFSIRPPLLQTPVSGFTGGVKGGRQGKGARQRFQIR